MQAIWDFIVAHWAVIITSGVVTYGVTKLIGWADSKGLQFLIAEMEKLRALSNSNNVLSQLKCDDALIDLVEQILPESVHDADEAVKTALAAGDIHKVDWTALGKDIWSKAKAHVVGGANDYLKNSSFSDGEALAAMIAKRFFITQKVAASGLITDAPRATVTDVTTTTTQAVALTRSVPPEKVVSEAVHTQIGNTGA